MELTTQQQTAIKSFNQQVDATVLERAKRVREELLQRREADRRGRKAQIDGLLRSQARATNQIAFVPTSHQYELTQKIASIDTELYKLLPSDIELLDELIAERETNG
jgi:hypothetical protein